MRVRLNGEWQTLRDGITVAELIQELGLEHKRIAVEVNRIIVPRQQHACLYLQDNDEIEVVHFVGGG